MQESLYKRGVTWPTLALVLLYCSNAAAPPCCQGSDFAAMLLPWFLECCCLSLLPCSCSVTAVVLPCCFVVLGVAVAEQALFDLYMTSAPVGHHVPRQPLVTGPHLHPSPASSPPSSSSPSTLPSSPQSSVTGPPCFSFSYPLFPHDFLLVKEKAASEVLPFYSVAFIQLTLHPCVVCLQ